MIQLLGTTNKDENVKRAIDLIRTAVKKHNARVVALPECFNAPYAEELFDQYAEYVPNGPTCQKLSNIAKELQIYLIGGSVPERDPDNPNVLYNTATVWSPDGVLVAKHRKVTEPYLFFWNTNENHVKCSFVYRCIYLILILKVYTNLLSQQF